MRKTILYITILVLLLFLVNAETYWDCLTRGYADTLYCSIADGCGGGAGGITADQNQSLVDYVLYVNSTNGEGSGGGFVNGSDIEVGWLGVDYVNASIINTTNISIRGVLKGEGSAVGGTLSDGSIHFDDNECVYFGSSDDSKICYDGISFNITTMEQDKDIFININDGGTAKEVIQIHGDSGIVSMPQQSGCRRYRTTDQSIGNNVQTNVNFDTEEHDAQSECTATTFTATEHGIYLATAQVQWQTATSGKVFWTQIISSGGMDIIVYDVGNGETYLPQICTGAFELNAGETLQVKVYQNTGTSRTLKMIGSGESTVFSVVKVA